MMAGAYVGLGIILIFCVGSDAEPAYRALIMGASFGIALTLVVFAGSDLFIGNHPESVSIAGMAHNLLWVTLGNIVSGAGIMGLGCWTASRMPAAKSVERVVPAE
jgi:nitrite transporter NirC